MYSLSDITIFGRYTTIWKSGIWKIYIYIFYNFILPFLIKQVCIKLIKSDSKDFHIVTKKFFELYIHQRILEKNFQHWQSNNNSALYNIYIKKL